MTPAILLGLVGLGFTLISTIVAAAMHLERRIGAIDRKVDVGFARIEERIAVGPGGSVVRGRAITEP